MSALTEELGIILPVYNGEKTIKRAIQSVISQTYPHWKLYVINDASTDNTLSILNEFIEDQRIFILNNTENSGVSFSRNTGLEIAKQHIICFIDSDDEWLPKKLETQVRKLKGNGGVVLTEYEYINEFKKLLVKYDSEKLSVNDFLKKKYRVCFSSVLINTRGDKKKFLNKGHEDFEFLYYYVAKYNGAIFVNEVMTKYYAMNDSLSSKKGRAALWHYRILKDILGNQFFKISVCYFNYMFNAIKFKLKKQG